MSPIPMTAPCLVVTDLDGTLLDSDSRLSDTNRSALETLGRNGVVRAVATGRSLYSARTVMNDAFPIDYLVFSSGVGIVSWPDGSHLASHSMDPRIVPKLVDRLQGLSLDFMVHHAGPFTHHFHFVRSSPHNRDFEHRIERYRQFARCWGDGLPDDVAVGQFVIVEPPGAVSCRDLLAREFEQVHVVRTTSPLDHASTWIELFPAGVSKAGASEWLRARHAVAPARTIAVGNDYNDLDMLAWARHAHVVANAPPSMRDRFRVARANDDDGFAGVVQDLLGRPAGP